MTFATVENVLRVAEQDADYGRQLAAAVTAARMLADEIVDAEKESAAVIHAYRGFANSVPQYGHGVNVSHGYTADNRRAAALSIPVVSAEQCGALESTRKRAAALAKRLEILDQYLAAFRDVRESLLSRRGERINEQQSALLSMLLASEPADKWASTKVERDHCGGINGRILQHAAHKYRHLSGAGEAITDRATFSRKTRKRGRISTKAGERLWTYSHNQTICRGGDIMRPSDTIQSAAHNLSMGGGRRAAELAEALAVWARYARGGWSSGRVERLSTASEPDIRGALAIRRRGITASRSAAARRLVDRTIASPSGAQSLAISAPETVGTIRRGAVEYSVLRWLVLVDRGAAESWEYGLAHHDSPEAECVPDCVQTFHATTADDAAAVESLTERIEDAERRAEYRRRERRSAAERRLLQRQRTAKVARALLSIPRVTLSDSYAVGNCRPGTREFCERIGVTESSLTGAELCRRWKLAGWPDNSLFVRVVERLAVSHAE